LNFNIFLKKCLCLFFLSALYPLISLLFLKKVLLTFLLTYFAYLFQNFIFTLLTFNFFAYPFLWYYKILLTFCLLFLQSRLVLLACFISLNITFKKKKFCLPFYLLILLTFFNYFFTPLTFLQTRLASLACFISLNLAILKKVLLQYLFSYFFCLPFLNFYFYSIYL
jgi:hypothetical protein